MSNEPKREDYPTDDAFIEAMAKHHGIDPRMCKQMLHNLGYMNKPGFLEKDDVLVIRRSKVKRLCENGEQVRPFHYEETFTIEVEKDEYLQVLKHMAEFWRSENSKEVRS